MSGRAWGLFTFLVAIAAATGFAVGRWTVPAPEPLWPPPQGPAVARWKTGAISEETLRQRLRLQPPLVRDQLRQPGARDEYLEGMVTTELLAEEALERRLHRDPAIEQELKGLLAQRLLERELDLDRISGTITEEERQRFFAERMAAAPPAARYRVSHLLLRVEPGDAEGLARKERELSALASRLRTAAGSDPHAFGREASRRSEDSSKQHDGDLGALTEQQLGQLFGEAFASAVSRLSPGEVSGPIRSDAGVHLVKVHQRLEAPAVEYDSVKDSLTSLLAATRRDAQRKALVEDLKRKKDLALDPGAADRVIAAP